MSMKITQKSSVQSLHLPVRFPGKFMPRKPARVRVYSPVFAVKRDAGHDKGRLVDENMIVLRMRIRQMKMAEGNNAPPPTNWMEWEKKWYVNYDSDVFEAVGLLQNLLMDSRPSFVVGGVALMILSGSTSLALLLFLLMDIFKGIHF